MSSLIEQRAKQVRAIIFDVDGVLTSGQIMYGPEGEWKVFNVQDGHGFKLAKRAGLKLGLSTGRASDAVRRRAEELDVDVFHQGVKDKGELFPVLLQQLDVTAGEACYVGDDVVDLPPMRMVGFPVAVANAVEEVKAQAAWITTRSGGDGAAREVIEYILKVQRKWSEVMKRYV